MESLKSLSECIEPDPRSKLFVRVDLRTGETRRIGLADIHDSLAKIQLNTSVPESVRTHFAQAHNLALYSWFNYHFHVTADFMSLVSIEYALRVKANASSHISLRKLVKRAVEEGWIRDEGFSNIAGTSGEPNEYVRKLIDVLPQRRNDLAHGTRMIHGDSLSVLRIAADFINQLFPS
jgi:hypothetical protein